MKKINNKGFVLAETLIVSVFLMVMFTMIYSNFYPLIGEYEKRENYDDVDGKYTVYWIKKMIESNSYSIGAPEIKMMNTYGYIRFECSDVSTENNQREMCINLVNSLEIANCDAYGDGCDAFITRYTIGDTNATPAPKSFKETIRTESIKRWEESCIMQKPLNDTADPSAASAEGGCATTVFQECCRQKGLKTCKTPVLSADYDDYEELYTESPKTIAKDNIAKYCNNRLTKKSFSSATKDYILSLPNYTIPHTTTGAEYRVIVVVHHQKDHNNYYSFSTMEVIK